MSIICGGMRIVNYCAVWNVNISDRVIAKETNKLMMINKKTAR